MIRKKYIVIGIIGDGVAYGTHPAGQTLYYDRRFTFSSKDDAMALADLLWGKCTVIENWVCEE